MKQPKWKHVVTCFLLSRELPQDGGQRDVILLLRRSNRVGTYQGLWAGVSGYVESSPDEQALIEIEEETGLTPTAVTLLRKGEPLKVVDRQLEQRWVVHPYLFLVAQRQAVRLDWEHTEARWIEPAQLGEFATVPMLREALGRVYPLARTVE